MSILGKLFSGFSLAVFVAVFGSIVFQSTRLRPIADDYCFGSSATDGPVGSVVGWLTGWTGSPFSVATQVLLTGWPVAALPVGISSSVSFIAAGLAVGLLVSYFLRANWGATPIKSSLLVVVVATGWFVSFRVGQIIELRAGDDPIGNRSWVFAEILTHWQTVNSGYVTASSLAMLLLGWSLLSPPSRSRRKRYVAIGLASLAVGWTSYVLAAAIAGAFLLVSLGIRLRESSSLPRTLGFSAVSIFAGVLTTFLFPGARARTDANVESSADLLLEAIRNAPSGLGTWVSDVFSAPTLFALLLGVTVASLGLEKRPSRLEPRPEGIAGILFLASLLTYILNEIVAVLMYGGLWHAVPGRLLIFQAALLLGVFLARLGRPREMKSTGLARILSVLETLTVLGVVFLTILGSVVLASSISSRQASWEAGPAEIRGITFMEDRDAEWVGECWVNLEEAGKDSE